MKEIQTKKGFTIIEVVLVLAIAGLIFLMVFIALPALQRNQRDTQRKNDMSRAQTAINSYQANNRGSVPASHTAMNSIISTYLTVGGDVFSDPQGSAYTFVDGGTGASPSTGISSASTHQIHYVTNAKCNGEAVAAGGGVNKVALRMKLEGGGIYCLNN